MSLLLAFILYGGSFTGYVAYDKVIQPYIQQQVAQEKKDWPTDQLGLKVEQENQKEFDALK